MKKITDVELSLLVLESYNFEEYAEEIDEIIYCIETNCLYDNAPELSRQDLSLVLENMCKRTQRQEATISLSLYDLLPDEFNFNQLREKVRSVLIESFGYSAESFY